MFDQKTKTIRDYRRLINKIVTDPSFERPYGCWGTKNINGFIQDVFCEFAATPIVLADANSCRMFAEELAKEAGIENCPDKGYFASYLTNGKHYISLDGKHRTRCLKDFLDNEISFTGMTVDDHGNKVRVRNKFFKDLKPEVQNRFLNSRICLTLFEDVKKEDLSKIFLSLNANETLTKQHKRNALQTPFAVWTRKVARDYRAFFKSMLNESGLAAMKPEEIISKYYLHAEDNKSEVGDRGLNALYHKGVGLQWKETYSSKSRLKTENILSVLNSLNSVVPLSQKKSLLFFLIAEKIVDENLLITNEQLFVDKVVSLDDSLDKQSRKKQSEDAESGETVLADYYFEQMRLNWSSGYRSIRQTTIWTEISKDLESYGISQNVLQAAK